MNTSAIIVCAGNSTRMGGVNKILLPLGDTLVIGNTLRAFEKAESIKTIKSGLRNSESASCFYLVLDERFI